MRNTILILLCLVSLSAHAQYNLPQSRIWAMGNKVGLDFTVPDSPAPIVTSLANIDEAAASVCDTAGHLLFYTNGTTVWNSSGMVMPNGTALTGTGGGATISTTQGAVIVPMPGNAGKYYIFSLTQISNCKLYCSVIDMSLNGGTGDIDITLPLFHTPIGSSFFTEKMTAVPGCNNSVWLMLHIQSSPAFCAYRITTSGIDTTPVLSAVSAFASANYQQGVMKFSPDGTKMLNCNFHSSTPTNSGLEVFSFDNTTGILSNGIILDSGTYYGGTFSPDGTKVYAGSTATSHILQWNLSTTSPATSKLVLGSSGQYTDLKLGPDGKIYFGAAPGGAGYSEYKYMGRINAPNNADSLCLFQDSVTALIFPSTSSYGALAQGMPNDVAVPVPAITQHFLSLDTTICAAVTSYTLSAPADYSGIIWDNGDTTASRIVTAHGTYWVSSSSACEMRIDTFVINGADMPALSIAYSSPLLTATAGFSSYTWYQDGTVITGAITNTFTATTNATYSVFGNFGSSCSDSTAYVVTGLTTGIKNYNNNNDITIYPNPASSKLYIDYYEPVNIVVRSMDGKEVLSLSNTLVADITMLDDGLYLIEITNNTGRRVAVRKLIKTGK